MELTIATFNIQNKYRIKNYSGIDKYGDHTIELLKFLKNYKIDVLGIQELTKRYQDRLLPILEKKYELAGKYRFTRLGNKIPPFNKFNEATSVISKYKILDTETTYIPSFPSIPRIITEILIEVDSKRVKAMSTHIDVFSDKIKKKQLEYLTKKLKKEVYPFILMGDFNATIGDFYFEDFIFKMREMGYKRVEVNEPTHKCRKLPIDHIFIPKSWKVEKARVIHLKNRMSDHKPIIATISF
ncbi:MAG: hypothetical protein HFJ12_02930 [Bacilli bacterium]|nr:hypothetical protein [Bacilli bacterium]